MTLSITILCYYAECHYASVTFYLLLCWMSLCWMSLSWVPLCLSVVMLSVIAPCKWCPIVNNGVKMFYKIDPLKSLQILFSNFVSEVEVVVTFLTSYLTTFASTLTLHRTETTCCKQRILVVSEIVLVFGGKCWLFFWQKKEVPVGGNEVKFCYVLLFSKNTASLHSAYRQSA